MIIPEERSYCLDEAEQRALSDLDALGLQYRLRAMGDGPCACWASLHDTDGGFVSGGWGKGEQQAARTGALYEALEHLLTGRHANHGVLIRSIDDLIVSMEADAGTSLPEALLLDQVEEHIACRTYTSLHDGPDFIYPLALAAPDYADAPLPGDSFDYAGLRRYASNSGTAIGASIDEATLHAMNECIERDAISLFLLKHFFYAQPAPLRVVHPATLPDDVADLHRCVSQVLDADITLLDISNELGPTSCLAVAHLLYPHSRPYGAGASLNPALAARRALTELVQSHLALTCDADEVREARDIAPDLRTRLQAWPRLCACIALDIEALLDSQVRIATTLRDIPAGTPREQVLRIAAGFQAQGLRAGYNVVHQTRAGTALVNVVVPRLERFFLVTIGNVVVPGHRGKAVGAAG